MTSIRSEKRNGVGVITIDRKERFNSLDVETARDLRRAGLSFARDDGVRAVILRGLPGVFCSGADLKYIRAGGDAGLEYLIPSSARPSPAASRHPLPVGEGNIPTTPASRESSISSPLPPGEGGPTRAKRVEGPGEGRAAGSHAQYGRIFQQILEYIHSTISEIRRAPKPFIAAVDGVAAAGGLGIAMSCDLVFASERASFEWAYSKTSLSGAESSTFFLPRLVGLRRAMEMLFLNPRLDAAAALDYGLITRVLPAAGFDEAVFAIAERLAMGATEAMGVAKSLMNEAAGMDRLDYHLDRELENLARVADGANFAEGIDAFFAKREPAFGAK